jgi:hypothetical protein
VPSAKERNDVRTDAILAENLKRLVGRRGSLVNEIIDALLPCCHDEINQALREPVVNTEIGGSMSGGTMLMPAGEKVISLYREIEKQVQSAVGGEFRAIAKLVRE